MGWIGRVRPHPEEKILIEELSTIQECQFCQLRFSCVISNPETHLFYTRWHLISHLLKLLMCDYSDENFYRGIQGNTNCTLKTFEGHQSFLRGHWHRRLWLLVMPKLGWILSLVCFVTCLQWTFQIHPRQQLLAFWWPAMVAFEAVIKSDTTKWPTLSLLTAYWVWGKVMFAQVFVCSQWRGSAWRGILPGGSV